MTTQEIEILTEVNEIPTLTNVDDKVNYVYNQINGAGLGGPLTDGQAFGLSKMNEVREWFKANLNE
jgi:hypothetical protein